MKWLAVNQTKIVCLFLGVGAAAAFRGGLGLHGGRQQYGLRTTYRYKNSAPWHASPTTDQPTREGNTPSRSNVAVRLLMRRILERLHVQDTTTIRNMRSTPKEEKKQKMPPLLQNWTKTRNYLYHTSDKIQLDQVDRVLDFLQITFDSDVIACILQQSPRILRIKNCDTKLRPVIQLLEKLYGRDVLKIAVRRNPDLLLTRGAGYKSDEIEVNEVLFKEELKLSSARLQKLKERLPSVFQMPVYKLLSVIDFFRHYLLAYNDGNAQQANAAIGKLLVSHPQVFVLSIERGLKPRIAFLRERCQWNDVDIGALIHSSSAGAVLGLSVKDNLKPTIDLLSERLEPEQLSKAIKAHPQLLGLSLTNLRAKLEYFDVVDESYRESRPGFPLALKKPKDTLAARVLIRAPTVFSLSLKVNLVPKVHFLAGLWGVSSPIWCPDNGSFVMIDPALHSAVSSPSLAQHLGQYPSVLCLSLQGNLQPTVDFYNRTGYFSVDCHWKLQSEIPLHTIRGRELAASLSGRLLPRWHFAMDAFATDVDDDEIDSTWKLPLHILVSATDMAFCQYLGLDADEYKVFKRESVPRLRFSSQFDTWLKTGRPIDV
jgi:hypothetical protein